MGDKVVAVDVDEVLFPFMRSFLDWRLTHGLPGYRIGDLVEYELSTVCGRWVIEESIAFLEDPRSLLVAPVQGATEAMDELARDHHVIAVTNRFGRDQGAATEDWLRKWIPGVQSVVYTTERPGSPGVPKHVLCSRLQAGWLIDDVPGNLRGLTGTRGLLFGNYRWQRGRDRELRRVRDWRRAVGAVLGGDEASWRHIPV